MDTTTSRLLTVMPFFSVLSVAGVLAFSETRVPLGDMQILSGAYQRAYEDNFSTNIPLTTFAQGAYTAATLALFGQAGPDVLIADADWVFTAEEFGPPDQTYAFLEELTRTRDLLQTRGIELVPVLVPDKARIYADLLPRSRSPGLEARYDQDRKSVV